MSRLLFRPTKTFPWYMRFFFYLQKRKYGQILPPMLAWGRVPGALLPFLMMTKYLFRKKSPLSMQLRTLLTVRISQINSCAYCVDLNSWLFMQAGGEKTELTELENFKDDKLLSEREKAALRYAEAMTYSDKKVDDNLVERLKKYFTDNELVELTTLIGVQNLSSKFNSALDVEVYGFCKIKKDT